MRPTLSLLTLLVTFVALSYSLYGSNFRVSYRGRPRRIKYQPLQKDDQFWAFYRRERVFRENHGGTKIAGRSWEGLRGLIGNSMDDLLKHFELKDVLGVNIDHADEILSKLIAKLTSIRGRGWWDDVSKPFVTATKYVEKETKHAAKVVAKETHHAAKVVSKETHHAAKVVVKETSTASKVVIKETEAAANIVAKETVSAANVVQKETVSAANVVQKETVSAAAQVEKEIISDANVVSEVAVDTADQIKEGAIATGEIIKDTAVEVGNQVASGAVQVGNVIKEGAEDLGNQVKDTALEVVDKLAEFTNDIKEYTERLIKEFGDYVMLLTIFGKEVIQMMIDVGTSAYKILKYAAEYYVLPSVLEISDMLQNWLESKISVSFALQSLFSRFRHIITVVKVIWILAKGCDVSTLIIPNAILANFGIKFYISVDNGLKMNETYEDRSNWNSYTKYSPQLKKALMAASSWDFSNPMVHVLVHGFSVDCKLKGFEVFNESKIIQIATKLHKIPGYGNIILMDWTILASRIHIDYFSAADGTADAGKQLADFLIKLKNIGAISNWDSVHLIGFSLGGHVVGVAGNRIFESTGYKIGRVTGLDPAKPLFEVSGLMARLPKYIIDKDDGHFVDIYHCNAGFGNQLFGVDSFGMGMPVGDVDIYINSNQGHSKCEGEGIQCPHSMCVKYFAESFDEYQYTACRAFYTTIGVQEDSRCNELGSPFGEDISTTEKGIYYVKTDDGVKIPSKINESAENDDYDLTLINFHT